MKIGKDNGTGSMKLERCSTLALVSLVHINDSCTDEKEMGVSYS